MTYALLKDGVQVTETTEFETGAYINAFDNREYFDFWQGAKLLKEGYEIKEVKE